MSSPLIVVVVAWVCSSKMALAECPCHPYNVSKSEMVCDDPSLTSIPSCVTSDINWLVITTPSIPLVPETIRRFTKLQTLGVWNIQDPQLSKTFLNGQKDISVFAISNTSLDYVDSDWFLFAPRIRTLFLESNKIPSLAEDTFRPLRLLETVALHNNQLTTLPVGLFEGTNLKNLYLAGNPWHCDCELAKFMQWARDKEVTIRDKAYCLYPVELKGLDLIDLTPKIACNY